MFSTLVGLALTARGPSRSEPAAMTALNAGVDLLLMPEDFQDAYQAVLQAAENGELPEARIDESVERILKVKIQMIGEDVVE